MAQIITGNEIVLIVNNRTPEIHEVDLISISPYGECSLREALIFTGLGLSHNESIRNDESSPGTTYEEKMKLYEKQYQFVELQEMDVVITYAKDPSKIYVQEVV